MQAQGHHSSILVQINGGGDFTSELFQQGCLKYVNWVRCKVSQPGGTGILERFNRTYKYRFAVRQDLQLTEALLQQHHEAVRVMSMAFFASCKTHW